MIAELTRHRAELVRVCQRYGVTRLDVFGSAASGDFDLHHDNHHRPHTASARSRSAPD